MVSFKTFVTQAFKKKITTNNNNKWFDSNPREISPSSVQIDKHNRDVSHKVEQEDL